MPIETYSVLGRLCAAVDKHRGRVERATIRVEELREEYRLASPLEQRQIAPKGFQARKVLETAKADLKAAELALETEEKRLLQPGSFLRFA